MNTKIEALTKNTIKGNVLLGKLLEFFKGSWLRKPASDEDIKTLEEAIKRSKEV